MLDIDVELMDENDKTFLAVHKHPYTGEKMIFEVYKKIPKVKVANVDGPIKGKTLAVDVIDDRLRSTATSSERWNDKITLESLKDAINKLKNDKKNELRNRNIESYMKMITLRNGYPPIHPNNRCRIKRISKERIMELNRKIQTFATAY